MKQSYEIQRLANPLLGNSPLIALSEAFSFGGGLVNGGLSKDVMHLLNPICGFDYMGSAEFEFGALPKALNAMVAAGELTAYPLQVKTEDKTPTWFSEDQAGGVCTDVVYVLCPFTQREEVSKRIRRFAQDENLERTRERVCLEEAIRIRTKGEHKPRILGWIELNNGYAFFLDKNMWKGFCKLFGVKVE